MRLLHYLLPVILLASLSQGQTSNVPPMIRFNGTYPNSSSQPGTTLASFTIYATENSNVPLWSETQRIDFEKDGNFTVLLGSATADGIPVSVFNGGECRWLEVEIDQISEPRIALVSVPYALKASDADTLGGLPSSAYVRVTTPVGTPVVDSTQAGSGAPLDSSVPTPRTEDARAAINGINGTPNFLAMFSDSTDIVNSVVQQSGNTVSIGGATSLGALTLIGNVPSGDAAGMALYNSGGGGGASVSLDMYNTYANGGIPQAKIKALDDGDYSDHLTFWTKLPGAASNPVSEKVRITSTGSVGIGTTHPSQMLEVNGNAQVDGNILLSGYLLGPGSSGSFLRAPNDGSFNFGAGFAALTGTTKGTQNTAVGDNALTGNSTGAGNTALGEAALYGNSSGASNTAVGTQALESNTTGGANVAIGAGALQQNTTGSYNVAIGSGAGASLPSGNQNIYIGSVSSSTAESNTIRIGTPSAQATYIAGIYGANMGNDGVLVFVNSMGQLGVMSSSRRYKEDIQDMGDASSGLMQLRPVTFRYKNPFKDGSKPIQYGLIAEEVAQVYPDLVSRSADGQIETVKYQVLDSMLLNEFQKLETRHAEDEKTISDLEQRLSKLEARLEKTGSR